MADQIVTIICRNIIYTRTIAAPQPYQAPRALNWRYQVPGKTYNQQSPIKFAYQVPRIINWRWQVPSN
jgi:hypothetical protein